MEKWFVLSFAFFLFGIFSAETLVSVIKKDTKKHIPNSKIWIFRTGAFFLWPMVMVFISNPMLGNMKKFFFNISFQIASIFLVAFICNAFGWNEFWPMVEYQFTVIAFWFAISMVLLIMIPVPKRKLI